MRVFLSIDLERDCPPFRDTYRGVTEGMPLLLDLLERENIPATFFTTGDIARRFPDLIKDLVGRGHEIGCHGDTHARLDKLSCKEAQNEITTATETLRTFYPVSSFRAPNLQLPEAQLETLKKLGYKLDSSEAKHKNFFLKTRTENGIVHLPASTTSLLLRGPRFIRKIILRCLKDPVVIFFHPWEFVDFRQERLRFDCRYNTGHNTLAALREIIDYYKAKGALFLRLNNS